MANILASDINGWYSQLNAILTKHGLEQITAPTITAKKTAVLASQLSALITKLGWAKTDEYYKYATYTDIPSVDQGGVIRGEVKSAVEATIGSIEAVVKCRNQVTNSYGESKTGNGNAYNSNSGCTNNGRSYCTTTGNGKAAGNGRSYCATTGNGKSVCATTGNGQSVCATTGNGQATYTAGCSGNVANNKSVNTKEGDTTGAGVNARVINTTTTTNSKYSYGQHGNTTGYSTTGTTNSTAGTTNSTAGTTNSTVGTAYSTTGTTNSTTCTNNGKTPKNSTNGYTAPVTTTTIDISNTNTVTYSNADCNKITE